MRQHDNYDYALSPVCTTASRLWIQIETDRHELLCEHSVSDPECIWEKDTIEMHCSDGQF